MDAGLKAGEQHGAQRAERGWERTRTRALSTRALSDARRQRDRPVAWKERDEPRPRVDLARHAALLQVAVQRRQVGLHHRVQYAQPLLQDTF